MVDVPDDHADQSEAAKSGEGFTEDDRVVQAEVHAPYPPPLRRPPCGAGDYWHHLEQVQDEPSGRAGRDQHQCDDEQHEVGLEAQANEIDSVSFENRDGRRRDRLKAAVVEDAKSPRTKTTPNKMSAARARRAPTSGEPRTPVPVWSSMGTASRAVRISAAVRALLDVDRKRFSHEVDDHLRRVRRCRFQLRGRGRRRSARKSAGKRHPAGDQLKSTTPRLKRSDRSSTTEPAICSGDM